MGRKRADNATSQEGDRGGKSKGRRAEEVERKRTGFERSRRRRREEREEGEGIGRGIPLPLVVRGTSTCPETFEGQENQTDKRWNLRQFHESIVKSFHLVDVDFEGCVHLVEGGGRDRNFSRVSKDDPNPWTAQVTQQQANQAKSPHCRKKEERTFIFPFCGGREKVGKNSRREEGRGRRVKGGGRRGRRWKEEETDMEAGQNNARRCGKHRVLAGSEQLRGNVLNLLLNDPDEAESAEVRSKNGLVAKAKVPWEQRLQDNKLATSFRHTTPSSAGMLIPSPRTQQCTMLALPLLTTIMATAAGALSSQEEKTQGPPSTRNRLLAASVDHRPLCPSPESDSPPSISHILLSSPSSLSFLPLSSLPPPSSLTCPLLAPQLRDESRPSSAIL
eukprot:171216-Hanusia_phi.AAC.1